MRWKVYGKLKPNVKMDDELIKHISFEPAKTYDTHESADEERNQLESGIFADRVEYYLVVVN